MPSEPDYNPCKKIMLITCKSHFICAVVMSSSLVIHSFIRFGTYLAISRNQIHPQRRTSYSRSLSLKTLRQFFSRLLCDTCWDSELTERKASMGLAKTCSLGSTVWARGLTRSPGLVVPVRAKGLTILGWFRQSWFQPDWSSWGRRALGRFLSKHGPQRRTTALASTALGYNPAPKPSGRVILDN